MNEIEKPETDWITKIGFIVLSITAFIIIGQREEYKSQLQQLKTEAVQHGFADYNSTNGGWGWKLTDTE